MSRSFKVKSETSIAQFIHGTRPPAARKANNKSGEPEKNVVNMAQFATGGFSRKNTVAILALVLIIILAQQPEVLVEATCTDISDFCENTNGSLEFYPHQNRPKRAFHPYRSERYLSKQISGILNEVTYLFFGFQFPSHMCLLLINLAYFRSNRFNIFSCLIAVMTGKFVRKSQVHRWKSKSMWQSARWDRWMRPGIDLSLLLLFTSGSTTWSL